MGPAVCFLLAAVSVAPASARHVRDDDPGAGRDDDGGYEDDDGPAEAEAEAFVAPAAPQAALGVGLRGGAALGLPLLGVTAGVEGRMRLLDGLALEPHVDVSVLPFPLIGFAGVQAGLPVVVSTTRADGNRPHLGAGPVVGTGTLFGHVQSVGPPPLFVGGEALAGLDMPSGTGLDMRFQLRAFAVAGYAKNGFFPSGGVVATMGLLLPL